MNEKKTWVVLGPSGLPVTQPAGNAWDAIDQLNVSMEDEWADYKSNGYKLVSQDCDPITFTPGVPTEDGWYVVKKQNRREKNLYYETIYTDGRRIVTAELDHLVPILSHAKLPEL